MSLLISTLLFRLVPLQKFFFILFGNGKRIGMLDMPVNKKPKHDENKEHLNKQQGIGLRLVVIGLRLIELIVT